MPISAPRRNASLLRSVEAVAFMLVMYAALRAMPFYPTWLVAVLVIVTGALAASSPPLASLLLVATLALPVMAVDFVVGVLFLIIGFSATQYLATDRALGFLLIALAVAAVPVHAEWAVCVFAGYALGRGRGAVAAVLACGLIEVAGLLLGAPALGSIATGGTPPGLIAFGAAPEGALTFAWLPAAVAQADPGRILTTLSGATDVPLLVVQPALWAAGAIVGGLFDAGARLRALFAGAGGVALLAAGSALARAALGGPVTMQTIGTTALVSAAAALTAILIAEWVFPPAVRTAPAQPADLRGMQAEDADVDDLLRLIASAEDELATRHRTETVVLITDMKSFSAMTEEVGSIESAKLVQRHRDVLIPVIERHGGKGKSTGGDGIVAAFDTSGDALAAAIDMQQTLDAAVETDPRAREMLVRIGIARGEVVLDKGGRPFLGTALNLAARVMDLADGGHVMTVGSVAATSGLPDETLYSHGEYKLKNIAEPITVVEVLWRDAMEPQQIRAT